LVTSPSNDLNPKEKVGAGGIVLVPLASYTIARWGLETTEPAFTHLDRKRWGKALWQAPRLGVSVTCLCPGWSNLQCQDFLRQQIEFNRKVERLKKLNEEQKAKDLEWLEESWNECQS